jgi:hypothetical protein
MVWAGADELCLCVLHIMWFKCGFFRGLHFSRLSHAGATSLHLILLLLSFEYNQL